MTATATPVPTVTATADSAAGDAVAEFFKANNIPDANAAPADGTAEKPDQTETDPTATGEEKPEVTDDASKTTDDSKEDAPALPEGFAAVTPIEGDLVAEFTVRDSTGELEVPNITIEYKANGRIRKDRLDQVVKMAQMGVHNVEREQRLQQQEQVLASRVEQVQQALEQREAQLEVLLSDPEVYEAARARFAEANAPEQKMARMERQMREREAQLAHQQDAAEGQRFISQEVLPALQTIAAACPEVTVEELSRELGLTFAKLAKNGRVSPRDYPLIRQYIVHELTDWAEDTHAKRYDRIQAATRVANDEKVKATAKVQQTKNQMARAVKPVGRGGAPATGASGKSGGAVSVGDAAEDAVQSALRSMNLGS